MDIQWAIDEALPPLESSLTSHNGWWELVDARCGWSLLIWVCELMVDQINPVSHFPLLCGGHWNQTPGHALEELEIWGSLFKESRSIYLQLEWRPSWFKPESLLEYLIRLCEDKSSSPSSVPPGLTSCYLKQTIRLKSSPLMFLVNDDNGVDCVVHPWPPDFWGKH